MSRVNKDDFLILQFGDFTYVEAPGKSPLLDVFSYFLRDCFHLAHKSYHFSKLLLKPTSIVFRCFLSLCTGTMYVHMYVSYSLTRCNVCAQA
jgi:hypothetical protein